MKTIALAGGLSILVLLGSSAWGAPRRGKVKPRAKPAAAKVAPVTEISVAENSATDIRGFGTATRWTLKSNGTVVRSGNYEGQHMGDPGQPYRHQGTFDPGDFRSLALHITASKLLDLKVAKPGDMEGTSEYSVVRGGKRRTVVVPNSVPNAKVWTTMKVVRGILADVEWKNDAGLAIDTGVNVSFEVPKEEQAPGFSLDSLPNFSVRNANGKEVAVAAVDGPSFGIHEPLPPGTYRIVPRHPTVNEPNAQGFAWRASQDSFQIYEGSFTYLTIAMQKVPAAP
jgi:hypothetical protein